MIDKINKIGKIYCLYNPQTLKIRYIGRTTVPLRKRLTQHISKAKNYKKYAFNKETRGSYKTNWINSLLKDGIRPKIKLLKEIKGWDESYIFEKHLIQKHLKRHNLVNGDCRGTGNFAKNHSPINRKKTIEKIKKHFNKEENKINFYNKIYIYNLKGEYLMESKSAKFASIDLNIPRNRIINQMNSINQNKPRKALKGMYFSHKKYEIYPYTRTEESLNRTVIYMNKTRFEYMLDFRKYYKLSQWDLSQLRKNIYTKRIKNLFKGNFIKIIKNGIAVLERNF